MVDNGDQRQERSTSAIISPSRTDFLQASPAGYAHPLYAQSLAEFGTPLELPGCGGWLLERPIRGADCRDAMGAYPLFACQDWSQFAADCEALRGRLVSLALVPDPFGPFDPASVAERFD